MRSTFAASLLAVSGFLGISATADPASAFDYFQSLNPPPAEGEPTPAAKSATQKLPPTEEQAIPNACDTCFSDASGPRWRPYAGTAATFLSANTLGSANSVTVINGPGATISQVNLFGEDSGLEATPRVWLGIANDNGLGARVRWWQMSQTANSFDFVDPVLTPGDLFGFNHTNGLELYTLDVEGTYDTQLGNWNVLGSLGMRHVGTKANSFASATEFVDIGGGSLDLVQGTAAGGSDFNGTGITFGVEALRPLWCKPCGSFDAYLSARGSALWGESSAYAASTASVTNAGFQAIAAQEAIAISDHDNLWIAEIQAGVQWSYYFDNGCCPKRAFFRTYFEYQNWDGADNAFALAATQASRVGVNQVTSVASSSGVNGLDLIGFGFATGFYW